MATSHTLTMETDPMSKTLTPAQTALQMHIADHPDWAITGRPAYRVAFIAGYTGCTAGKPRTAVGTRSLVSMTGWLAGWDAAASRTA